MNRREFLASLGVAAVAVSLNGIPLAQQSIEDELHVGDIFTVEGYYAFNPITRKATPHLQQLIVTAIHTDRVDCSPKLRNGRSLKRKDIQPVNWSPK